MKKITIAILSVLMLSSCASMYNYNTTSHYDKERFGEPNRVSYHSSTPHTPPQKIYTWYCANGAYRSYTYARRMARIDGENIYIRENTYISTCIK